jgi:hypothetical protein
VGVPLNSVQLYLKGLLDGLPMPGAAGNLAAYITPPDPNEETQVPTAYIWPSQAKESRDPKTGGSIPRNTGPGTPSATKSLVHDVDIYLVWFAANDDPDADTWFPGMVDAVMYTLRTAPDPVQVTDPYSGMSSQLVNVGEQMDVKIGLIAVGDEVFGRYDALITVTVWEIFRA